MDNKKIGMNLKRCRLRMGLTQAELAEKVDKSTNHIAHIENGTAKMSLKTLLDICNEINASPNEIFFGEYPMGKEDADEILGQLLEKMESRQRELLLKLAWLLADNGGEPDTIYLQEKLKQR